jgi:GNAT superfamily N-acetyltransferase
MEISFEVSKADRAAFSEILASSGYFYDFEIDVTLSLLDDTCENGEEKSGYYWIRVLESDKVIGFATYGPNPCTSHSWDLYWLAVHEDFRNKHIGSVMLKKVEEQTKIHGGKILWIETAGRPLYEPTRHFYTKNNYELEGSLRDYYGPGDAKLVYRKEL